MAESLTNTRIPFSRWPYSPYPLAFVVLAIGLAVSGLFRKPADWENVYVPAAARLRAGNDLFLQAYVYPPAAAWLTLPCTYLSPFASRFVWYAASVAALGVVLLGAWRLTGGGRLPGAAGVPRREHLILLGGLACGLAFVFDCWSNRQTDVIVAALVIAGCGRLSAGRPLTAGAWFGVAAGLKCTPLLWAPYLAWRRQFGAAVVVAGVALAVNLAPDVTHPSPQGSRLVQWANQYLLPMAQKDRDPGVWASAIHFNHSVAGVFNRWLTAERTMRDGHTDAVESPTRVSPTILKTAVYGFDLTLVLLGLLAIGRIRQSGPLGLDYSAVVLLMLLLSPMSSKPHFCTLILPGFCLSRLAIERHDRILMGAVATAAILTLLSNKDLWGTRVYDFAMWYGSVFGSALVLYLGTVGAGLSRSRSRPTTAEPSADAVREPGLIAAVN